MDPPRLAHRPDHLPPPHPPRPPAHRPASPAPPVPTMTLAWSTSRPPAACPWPAASSARVSFSRKTPRTGPEPRLHAVLHHELAHLHRRDCLWQLLGQLARAIYWFNPLAWLAYRQLLCESEKACDDAVIIQGSDPIDLRRAPDGHRHRRPFRTHSRRRRDCHGPAEYSGGTTDGDSG